MAARSRDMKRSVTAWLDREDIARLDELAQKMGSNRCRLMEDIITVILPDLMKMENLGFLRSAILWRDLKESLNAWVENAEQGGFGECERDCG